jgi:outer membrane protein assembly factor BamB
VRSLDHTYFDPNESVGGFCSGIHDLLSILPTSSNWIRQSRFVGPDQPRIETSIEIITQLKHSSFVVGNEGETYFGGHDGLYALNSNGSIKWKFESAQPLTAPILSRFGTILFGTEGAWKSKGHKLVALNTLGEQLWTFDTDEVSSFSPVIGKDDVIYLATHGSNLHAVHPNGTSKWLFKADLEFWTSPIVSNEDTIYIGAGNEKWFAINTLGVEKWSIHVGKGSRSNYPIIDLKGNVYQYSSLGSHGQINLLVIDSDGNTKWLFAPKEGFISTTPALSNLGTLCMGASLFRVISIDLQGNLLWETRVEGFVQQPPVFDRNGTAYVIAYNDIRGKRFSWLYALNLQGEIKWKLKIEGEAACPVIGENGTIRILSNVSKKGLVKFILITNK